VTGAAGGGDSFAGSAARLGLSVRQRGSDQSAQVFEAVGGYQAGGDQLPEAGFDFGFEASGGAHHVGEEKRAALLEEFEHRLRHWTQERGGGILGAGVMSTHPIGILAHEEGDGRDSGGNHAAANHAAILAGGCSFERGRMRREATPSHGPGKTELIEVGGS